ncbi:hypothetical protein, partial [Escherichia coli]|uniref:hypothetical protein n=1 Tax=Escherichia coli TaxID=562 RepID=UPI001BAE6665
LIRKIGTRPPVQVEWLKKDRQMLAFWASERKTLRTGGITLVWCYDDKCPVRVSKPEFISAYQHAQSRPLNVNLK